MTHTLLYTFGVKDNHTLYTTLYLKLTSTVFLIMTNYYRMVPHVAPFKVYKTFFNQILLRTSHKFQLLYNIKLVIQSGISRKYQKTTCLTKYNILKYQICYTLQILQDIKHNHFEVPKMLHPSDLQI